MMQKTMSSEAMQPTRKPHIRGVSEIQKPNTITNHTTIQKKELFSLTDNIKEDMFSLSNDSPFKQGIFNGHNNQLASSFSYSQDEGENQYQKLLFAKFLQSKPSQWIVYMHEMNKIASENLVDVVKIGQTEESIKSNRIIGHYIGVWLISMGYKDIQTRRRLIMNVRYLYPNEQAVENIAGMLFDMLFQGYMPQNLQLKLLIEVCKRGWEYLAFFIGNFIKILMKYSNRKQDLFLQELYKLFK